MSYEEKAETIAIKKVSNPASGAMQNTTIPMLRPSLFSLWINYGASKRWLRHTYSELQCNMGPARGEEKALRMRQDRSTEGEPEQEWGVGQADTNGALAGGDKQKD
ncbi:hypothetical protein EYF80_002930 [Liparis tanakae]|uniref:Uncharacterized protein n=1 Tax=Liparis tanakae TaxID=230148 RepID=A0A4Z2J9M4_9TELE|nr:hypothetical protein EYF80_002930 [Liparis tanakae]